ncbi:MAG: hypothetical protein ACTSYB_10610 [Candidatus Helarchaeota archaeon]
MDLEELRRQMPEIFEQVKQDVEREIRRHRAGLSLGLVEMGVYKGNFIAGLFFTGGTMILMNTTPLRIITAEQPDIVVWSYVYHVLLHEYLHSLGFINEKQCKILTIEISKNVFKDVKHPAVIFATKGLGAYFPKLHLIYAPTNFSLQKGVRIEKIKEFDKSSYQSYFI